MWEDKTSLKNTPSSNKLSLSCSKFLTFSYFCWVPFSSSLVQNNNILCQISIVTSEGIKLQNSTHIYTKPHTFPVLESSIWILVNEHVPKLLGAYSKNSDRNTFIRILLMFQKIINHFNMLSLGACITVQVLKQKWQIWLSEGKRQLETKIWYILKN